jgi:hypothetical protein
LSNFCFKFSIEGLVSFSRIILCIFTNCTTRYSGMPSFGVDEVLQSFVQCAPYFVSLSPMPRPYLVPLPHAYSTCILHLHLPWLGLVSAGRLSPRCPLPRSTPGICHSHDGAPLGSIVKCSGRISSSCPNGSIR